MSQIIVNIPDCATGSHDDHDVITVTVQDCPVPIAAPPPLIPSWTFILGAVVMLAVILATAIVRFRRHERLQAEHKSDDEVEIAKANRRTTSCPTCGTVYVPEEAKQAHKTYADEVE